MGILDSETINQIQAELVALHPNVYLYGEGWKMATGLEYDKLAHQYNVNNYQISVSSMTTIVILSKKLLLNRNRLIETIT